MGEDCAVSFEFVDYIEPTASGKFRFTVSKVHGMASDRPCTVATGPSLEVRSP